MKPYLFLLALIICFAGSCKKETKSKDQLPFGYDNGPTDSLKLNQIQVIASHNSYRLRTNDSIFNWMTNAMNLGILPAQYDPKGIDYTHLPVEQQMSDYQVRGLELDIYNDPQGGNFYYRQGMYMVGLSKDSQVPELMEPGFKILHIPDFDFNTNYYTFKQGLTAVYNWSVAHPNHLPIFINIETKEETVGDALPGIPDLAHAVPYNASACDKMDEEIKAVFGDALNKVITPDKVRGSYASLEEAALAGNWPTLAEARNKVVFIMEGAAESIYKAGHTSLQGRAMFVYSTPGTAEAAFVIMNNSSQVAQIRSRVQQGYIVRTRADDGTTEARTGDYSQMNNAFNSWAQIVSTDYYKADARAGTTGWTDYHVRFPNGELARIDSISATDKINLGIIKE